MWVKNSLPKESGYYKTLYHLPLSDTNYFKALWFDAKSSKWIWKQEVVVKYWWDVRHEYYVECQDQKVSELPAED